VIKGIIVGLFLFFMLYWLVGSLSWSVVIGVIAAATIFVLSRIRTIRR